MSSKTKWIIAAVLVLGIVVVAQASVLNDIYMPVIYVGPTITPIPTATPKPTDCLRQDFHGQNLKVCFTDIDQKPTTSKLDEFVEIKNLENSPVDMEGWRIASDFSGELFKYDFPKFTLNSQKTVKVWTKIGTDSSTQLYMNLTENLLAENGEHGFWKNNEDCGYLKNDSRQTINSFCYGTTGFTAAPENK